VTRRVLLLSFAALAAGCGHTETHVAMLRAPQPRTQATVELYVADQPPPTRPYYEIALVQAIGYGSDATPELVTRALTDRAGSIGCDAVVRTFIDLGYSRAHAAGVCVKYLVAGPPAPPPNLSNIPRPTGPGVAPAGTETLPSNMNPPGPPNRGADQR
jgi:hypothetical protein